MTITAKINNESILDNDGIAVFHITDPSKKLIVTASKEGCEDVVQTFALDDLILEEDE